MRIEDRAPRRGLPPQRPVAHALIRWFVDADSDCHQKDAPNFGPRRYLSENHYADDRGCCRQQGEHGRKRRARQPRHRKLVADVRDYRRRYAHTDSRQNQHRFGQHRNHVGHSDWHCDDQRDKHRSAEPINSRCAAEAGNSVAEDDVNSEQNRVNNGEQHAESVAGPLESDQEEDARHGN